MMKKFLSGVLVTALVLGSASFAAPAKETEAASVPKATYTFNMNGANKNVVAVGHKDPTANLTPAKTGVFPTEKDAKTLGAKLKYVKGKNGKALYIDRTKAYGAQLKGVNLGAGDMTISFWVKVPSGMGEYNSMFFGASDVSDTNAKWFSITKGGSAWPNTGAPVIWSHAMNNGKDLGFPWYNKNGVNKKGEAVWEAGDAFSSKTWTHVVLVIKTKGKDSTCEYGTKGEDGYVKGYHAYTYINGKAWGNGTVVKGAISSKNKYFLGINAWDTPMKAYYDDVMLWKGKALTAKQVKKLYKSQK